METGELISLPKGGFAHDRDLESGKEEWLTPIAIINALGEFDLDPCSPVEELRPWPTAKNHYSIRDNGLMKPWSGRAFCNPPYGTETGKWLGRCADHKNATGLIFARTETQQFFDNIWSRATAVGFIKGRINFWELTCSICNRGLSDKGHKPGNAFLHAPKPCNKAIRGGASGAPSMLVAWDAFNAQQIQNAFSAGTINGKFVEL